METNNISTTEDAFEQFVQDFEPNDFITLSELVPSSYASNEVMDTIIMEVPSGQTEVRNVLDNITFASDDQQTNIQEISTLPSGHTVAHNVMDNVTFGIEEQQVSVQEINSELPSKTYVVYSGNQPQKESPIKVAKKRGRKKKLDNIVLGNNAEPVDNSDLNFDMIIGEDDFPATVPTTRKAVKSLKTEFIKTSTPNASQKPKPGKKPRGRPPKKTIFLPSPDITTPTVETRKKREQKKKCDPIPASQLTSTIKKYAVGKKYDPNIHGVVLNNESENCDITSSSIVDMKCEGFVSNVAEEVIVTNEETKGVSKDAVDMSSEIVGEVEVMTSNNDEMDNLPLVQLSKVINKSVPKLSKNTHSKSITAKSDQKEFITKSTKKKKLKKNIANVEDDCMDNVCLSKLKNNINDTTMGNDTNVNEQHEDITTTVQETIEMDKATPLNDSQLDSAETSKRPVRRKAKKILHYEQDSDEDPFANVDLSDDEPGTGKKGSRYYSDDEYVPGMENGIRPSKFSDSDAEDDLEFIKNVKKRKLSKSPKKKITEDNVASSPHEIEDDIEGCIETSVIKLTEGESNWGTTKEFENFLANKVGSDVFIKKSKSTKSTIAPLEIPVLDLNEPKKIVEISTQTNVVSTKNSFAQTDTQHELSMAEQVKLTAEQSEKACEFLSSIVKTTAELGQLMTQKSEDFIEKKINTTHVTDTLKMDYCVKKSFLLFKLAKHNLIQMEEDLARQYEDFLNSQNLSQHREKRKVIAAKAKEESDSDCEIVEVIADDGKNGTEKKKKEKPAFNPKTVFLNKELSIKIAKKPSTPSVSADPKSAKNINIKGRHTVWINDSIMVKKVKPNQSFLAQDSRNKKPPDSQFVTLKMVNSFFESYNRQKVLSTCAPFVRCDWFTSKKSYNCFYSTEIVSASSSNSTLIGNSTPIVTIPDSSTHIKIPKPLLTLCIVVLKKLIKLNNQLDIEKVLHQSDTRYPISIHNKGGEFNIPLNEKNTVDGVKSEILKNIACCAENAECQINTRRVKSLSVLCLLELQKHIYLTDVKTNMHNSIIVHPEDRNYAENIDADNMSQKNYTNVKFLTTICLQELQKMFYDESSPTRNTILISNHTSIESNKVKSLSMLCLQELQNIFCMSAQNSRNEKKSNCSYKLMDFITENENDVENNNTKKSNRNKNKNTLYQYKNNVNNLQTICYQKIVELIFKFPESCLIHLEPTIINTFSLKPVDEIRNKEVKSLFLLCTSYIQNIQCLHYKQQTIQRNIPFYTPKSLSRLSLKCLKNKIMPKTNSINQRKRQIVQVKTLARLCLELISSTLNKEKCSISNNKKIISEYCDLIVLPLKKLCFDKITNFMGLPCQIPDFEKSSHGLSITINEINTVSEDFFNNDYNSFDDDGAYDETEIGETNEESQGEVENNYNNWENDEDIPSSNEWAANIQMGDLRSCVDGRKNNEDRVTNTYHEEASCRNPLETGILSNIKQEPCEEAHYMPNIMTIIKNEPYEDVLHTESLHGITKTEHMVHEAIENTESPLCHVSNGYDVDAFEKFVSSNKLMYSLADGGSQDEEEVYGQSFSRVRRQYEPDFDSDGDNFDNLGLLIPQTVEQAKDKLMNSSSDEESKNKKNDKRKYVKKKGKLRKPNKEILPIKSKNVDDVAVLTKKMKQRLQQEDHQKDVSDEEDVPLILRKDRSKKLLKTDKQVVKIDTNNQDTLVENKKDEDSDPNTYEIQCNNIDSTENLETTQEKDKRRSHRKNNKLHLKNNEIAKDETNDLSSKNIDESKDIETSPCDKSIAEEDLEQNQDFNDLDLRKSLRKKSKLHQKNETISEDKSDTSSLKNNDVSEGVKTSPNEESKDHDNSESESYSDAVDMAEPIELLECEPTLPVFDTQTDKKQKKTQKETDDTSTSDKYKSQEIVIRNGWECYPIDHSDTKLYEHACISLEKLPESFVETYFKYINIDNDKDEDDIEIDRLTNLQSLNREKIKSKEVTRRSKTKAKTVSSDPSDGEVNIKIELEAENGDELSPSEDENDNTDDILPSTVQENNAENYLAKSLLMGDNDSETEDADGASEKPENKIKRKPGPKSKTKGPENTKVKNSPSSIVKKEDGADLLLTADRMMNSELALLHAPVMGITDQIIEKDKETTKKNKQPKSKTSSRSQTTTVHIRKDDDSSSEEEKQWVTTKEKLLKRLEKKQENHIDDAKRAKIVSEFIEKRREDGPVSQSVLRRPRRGRSNRKKLLERRKQMKVLSRELCGEDASSSKRYSHSYGKGRRNIRKVIDKKSLARNTVLANIEEFERKRRLSMREAQLKETLGFEEDVNVVVINDELCLEYDFDNNQPAVTVHPFFTKVMKAHQYEGVKFMWDACFETVETVQNGGTGGGCILAHCMGLGKTLQVLALLHTVLTHPGVAMQRVLVCCPLSTVLNWVDEIHKWIGPVTNQIKVFELSKLKKTYERAYQLEDWYNGGGIFIIGYELFRSLTTLDPMLDDVRPTIINKIRTALLDPGPDIIICDEGHLLKNDMSVLAVAMSRVVTKRRIVLTGTPMQNNLREYYCMVNFIKPNLLGTYSEYSNRFENPIMNGQHRDSIEDDIKLMKQRTHILHKVLEGCLQRQEASVLYPYLPKKYEYTVFISLTSCQWDLYKHYISQTKVTCKGNKHNVLKDFHVLQKIWSHPQVLHHFQTRGREADEKIKAEKLEDELLRDDLTATEDIKPTPTDVWWLQYLDGGRMLDMLDSSNKFLVVFRLLDECVALGDKVLIFSTSLYALDALEYFLRVINGWSLGQDYYRLDGAVPPEVRQKWCREFNDESNTHTKLFLISTRAGCLGLNMTAANRVIILDTSWNPAHDIQSIFRVYRFGQKKDCYIYRLVAMGTMEQKMYERSVTKQAVACRVVDEQQIDRHYNMAELSELYNYDEEGLSVDAGLAAGVRDAALLRVAAALQGSAGALHAVREHDSLLRDTDARLPEHERAAAWQQFQQEHAEEQPLVKIPKKFQIKVDATSNTSENTTESRPLRKRGRPRKFSPEPSPPSTSKLNDFDMTQEVIVNKIRDLLIQHNAMEATPAAIAKMIGEVRKYIVDPSIDIGSNPLVGKIAEVLLLQNMPPLTDCLEPGQRNVKEEPETILGDSESTAMVTRHDKDVIEPDNHPDSDETLSDVEMQHTEKRRKRPKVDDDYVPPSHYMYKMEDTTNITTNKKKKKETRCRPRKNVAKIPPPSVEKTRTAPLRNAQDVPADTVQNIENDDSNSRVELTGVHTIDDGINEDTIDISDDDDLGAAPTPAPAKRKEPPNPTKKPPETTKELLKTPKEMPKTPKEMPKTTKEMLKKGNELPDDILLPARTSAEAVPLPKSLLTDKKFIKIVAHMYVSSSPILDEDAATRAAEYSTSKALRELNETGEQILSGNLHEIALKVYGPEALKKLNLCEETKKKAADLNADSGQSSASKKVKPIVLKKNKILHPLQTTSNTNTAEIEITPEPHHQITPPRVSAQPKVPLQPIAVPQHTTAPPSASNAFQFRIAPRPPVTQSEVVHTPPTSHSMVPSPVGQYIVQVPAASAPAVVPVGMFTGAGTIAVPNSREESILPDDDDIMVIPLNPTPQPAETNNYLSALLAKPQDMGALVVKQQNLGRSRSQPLLVNTVSSSSSNTALVNTIPNTNSAKTVCETNKTQIKLPKLAPASADKTLKKRTYFIKTSELEAALANYPDGQGPTIHLDSGKVMVPVQIIKQTKQSTGADVPSLVHKTAPSTPNKKANILIPRAGAKATPSKPASNATPIIYAPICLDSDEEDTNTNTVHKTKKPETPVQGPSKVDVRPTKNTEPKQGTSKVDVRPTKNAEPKQGTSKVYKNPHPKTPVQGSSKADAIPSKQPEKKTPAPGSVQSEKNKKTTLTDININFNKHLKTIEVSPTSNKATNKEPDKPKKVTDTKSKEPKTGTVMFDDGASIEFVSICDNPALTPKAKSTDVTASASKKIPEKPKTDTSKYKPKPKSKQASGPQIDLGMIDLTSAPEPKKNTKVIKTTPKAISGTSKDILITNAGKLTTDKGKPSGSNIDLTGAVNFNNTKPSPSVKRTKKPEVITPVKKPKVEIKSKPSSALKSLMDLTFDDIDDIVELE